MRRAAFYLLVVPLALALASSYGAAKEESVDEMKAHFESARLEDRAELGIRIAQHQLHSADELYNAGKVEPARAAVEEIAIYSERARDAAIQTKKRLKNVEIDVRKMADKLRASSTLAFEDQPPVDQAIRRLEGAHNATPGDVRQR